MRGFQNIGGMKFRSFCMAAAIGSAISAAEAALVYQTIALTGTDGPLGPGMGPGVTFPTIGQQQPAINNSGQVSFRANHSLAGTPQGVWIHSGVANANVAIAGGPMPGGGTYTSGTSGIFNSTLINNTGHNALRLGASTGVFADTGGGMDRVIVGGDTAPGTGGATYASVQSGMPLLNHSGQVGYIGSLTAGSGTPAVVTTGATANAQGFWVGPAGAGAQTLAIRQNDAMLALDPSGETRVGTFSQLTASMNGLGHYVTLSNLQGANVVTGTGATGNSTMISSNRGGSPAAVARAGDFAVNASGAISATDRYRTFGAGTIAYNDLDHMAFSSSLKDAAGTQTATGAFFTDANTSVMRMIARIGDAMPPIFAANDVGNTSPLAEFSGVTWGSSYNNAVMNNNDTLAFQASGMGNTGGTNNTGALLRMDSSNQFHKIMRNGDVAIAGGAPDGTDAFFLNITSIQLNDFDQIAFQSTLTGNGVSVGLGNGSAIFAADSDGSLCLVARTGDLFEVAPGDLRTIQTIGGLTTSGGQDGRAINLNDNGDLVFELDFVGGSSGIFVAAVPEPSAFFGMLVLVAGMRIRRR